jgi:tetratricopeptide (TPR) repeat protein
MVRFDGDHVNWVLVVILVAMALLMAMVSSTAYGSVQVADPQAVARADQARHFWQMAAQERKEVRTPSEASYTARELYQTGRVAEARGMFEKVLAVYPHDPAVRMWAGMAAYRTGDHTAAVAHWQAAWDEEGCVFELRLWPAVALGAVQLESGQLDRAARFIVPLERGDLGPDAVNHPVVSFYAAMVYEQLAIKAPKYRDAVEESLREKFSPAIASSDASMQVSPNSQSWLIFLTKRALQRTNRGARSLDRAAPIVPESATMEPSFAPTVEELLDCLGSADFASQARGKLRALELYQSPPDRKIEIFDDPELMRRGRFIA